MGFRDEREALRFQVDVLEREIAEQSKELEGQAQKLAELDADIDREVTLVHGRGRVLLVLPILIFGVVIGGIMVGARTGTSAEMLFGDVRVATGTAPVPMGARCTLFVTPAGKDNAKLDTDLEVLCDGRLVYGGDSLGAIGCQKIDGRAVLCEDPTFTVQDGDPKVRLDRRAGTVVVEDRAPDFRLEIGLAPPPRRLP